MNFEDILLRIFSAVMLGAFCFAIVCGCIMLGRFVFG